ncbi:hypothetical protein [Solidesulfovibrio sp.]
MPSRGIRNQNPGNIRHSPDKWLGEVPGNDKSFKTFSDPVYGIRALAKLLLNYERKYGLNTISGIISRWAPTVENNTAAYIDAVAKACGVDPFQVIDVAAYLPALVPAIIAHENGSQPYTDEQISQAIAMVTGGDNAPSVADVAPAQPESPTPGVPPYSVLPVGDGKKMVETVGAGLPGHGAVTETLKTLAKSKTMGGVVGLLALQLLGIDKWDVALRVHDTIYAIPDLSQYLAVGLAGLATWGRVTATPMRAKSNA